MNVTFIGGGNMASAIIAGLTEKKYIISVIGPRPEIRFSLVKNTKGKNL